MKNPPASLTDLAQESHSLGVKVNPQAIHERINGYSVEFMQRMFWHAFEQFKNKLALPLAILQQFNGIFIVDSTYKSLPVNMEKEYPGAGGKGSTAGLKVQFVLEFTKGNMVQLEIEPGTKPDQKYEKCLELLEKGSLIITDLGYLSIGFLRKIKDKTGYFLTRYRYKTTLYSQSGEKIDLIELLKEQEEEMLDIKVEIGESKKNRVPARLISTKVPPQVAEERRRKAKRKSQVRKRTCTQAYLDSLGWSIYLTNVPPSMLSGAQVILFYRIRWQIELIFKFWKSYCGLKTIPGTRSERVLTEFYTKLLVAVLCNFVIAPIRVPEEEWFNHEISIFKVQKIFSNFSQKIMLAIPTLVTLLELMDDLFEQIILFGCKQKRCKNPNLLARLAELTAPSH